MTTTMELCTVRGIPKFPSLRPNHVSSTHIQFQPFLLRKTNDFHLPKQTRFNAGLQYHTNNSYLRSSVSDEVSTQPDGKATVEEDARPLEREGNYYSQINEAPPKQPLADISSFEFLENLNLKFDYEDPYSILVFGGGGAVALWLLSAVVGAVDSIPVLPKLLELVGFGYTVWFTSRYLIFKKNRDELVAKVEQLKQQVLGSEDE